jgi:O-succinylbenzoate synthase
MKIERVDLIVLKIPIVGHFETSYGRLYEEDKLLLKFYTRDFIVYTECVAETSLGYTYETIGTAIEILKSHLLPAIMGKAIEGPDDFWKHCGCFRGHPMTKAAVENAFWVFKALEEEVSLATLLGNTKRAVLSGVSIGIQDSAEALLEKAAEFVDQGYPRIKIKIKPGRDVDDIAAMRKRFPDVTLMVDANNAYSLDDLDVLKVMDDYDLQMIEQPLAFDDIFDHAKLQRQLKTAICLDESIQSPYHARVALETKACRIINIKQGRVAGLARAKQIHDLCATGGVGVWCGGMFETGVGRAVLVALAGLPNFIYPNDISASQRYYPRDIVEPEFTLNPDGTISVPEGPGLGVEVNPRVLARYKQSMETITI